MNNTRLNTAEHMPAAKHRAFTGNSSLQNMNGTSINPVVNSREQIRTISGKYEPLSSADAGAFSKSKDRVPNGKYNIA